MSLIQRGTGRSLTGVAYAFGVVMAGTTLPTPLYPEYERHYDFTSLGTTVLYATYALGVLAVLIFIGTASDKIGRRPLLLGALTCSLASAVIFVADSGLATLFVGRVLSGISAGVFTGTATVALVELASPAWRSGVSVLASAVNMLGLGCGPLLSGIVASLFPAPLLLPYLVHIALLIPALIAVVRMPETVLCPMRVWPAPTIPRIPASARAVFVPAAVVASVAFTVLGLVTAIVPGYLATVLHLASPSLSGLVAFLAFASSAAGQIGLTRLVGRHALVWGCLVLLAGLATIGVALVVGSFATIVSGVVIIGTGQGITFSAGISSLTIVSPGDRRGETVSAFFIVAYVGISVPVVLIGLGASVWGLREAGIVFVAVAAVLVLSALAAVLRILPQLDNPGSS